MLSAIFPTLTLPTTPSTSLPSFSTLPPFAYFQDLKALTQHLILNEEGVDYCLKWKKEIKAFIHEHCNDLVKLDEFLKDIAEWGIEKNPQKMMVLITEIVDLELITRVIKDKEKNSAVPFENIFEWAAEHEPFCPKISTHSTKQLYSEWKKFRPVALYFIPNLINIFLSAFNFLDSHKKFTPPFEKHLYIEIIYKLFLIPYVLIKILQPIFIETAKVYAVAAAIIFSVGILLSCYQRWFRPIPDEIVNCINLDKQMDKGFIDPKVGQTKELDELIAALEVGSNVLLIGNSGDGKTALLHHLIRKKHAGELPKKLQDLSIYEVDSGLLVSSYNYGYSEAINEIKNQTEGYEEKILFSFDEFYLIMNNKDAFKAFKKRFLEDKPRARFIVALTYKEFEEMEKIDLDGSFRRRIVEIFMQASSDEQNRLILRELINRVAKDILVTEEAIEEILKVSVSDHYLPGIGRPARVEKILMDAMGLCRSAYNPHYMSAELSEVHQEYQDLQLKSIHQVKVNPDTLKKARELKAKIQDLEEKSKKDKDQVIKIKKLMADQQKFNREYYQLTHLLANASSLSFKKFKEKKTVLDNRQDKEKDVQLLEDESETIKFLKGAKPSVSKGLIDEDAQVMYLWYHFYALDAMKKLLQNEIDKVRPRLPVQVDKDLIHEVAEKAKKKYEHLYANKQNGQIGNQDDDDVLLDDGETSDND